MGVLLSQIVFVFGNSFQRLPFFVPYSFTFTYPYSRIRTYTYVFTTTRASHRVCTYESAATDNTHVFTPVHSVTDRAMQTDTRNHTFSFTQSIKRCTTGGGEVSCSGQIV